MDSEYDCKFEEMKKYIPFLENMITRLESTNTTSSNPRQAQLDKIRSLRDLLSNKKKRMKMENLLKCEQVLVNLYAKVEQRDTLSSSKKDTDSGFSIDSPTLKEKSDLEVVRNKLKNVAKRQENIQDTLPEILPRSEINDVHTSGTKEPALFQRRPNQTQSLTKKDTDELKTSPPGSVSRRNYTRVLVSPETSSRRWSPSEGSSDKPLFSRRSPRKSPRRVSPSYHKKERKKSKEWQSRKQRDLNITLNVPEESLNSLNTKDILSRIINCSDGDVDIETLRELRKQILGELQKTGARDDISDLILKSYNKNINQTKEKTPTKKEEIEEGELSDSESEAIESIYGSLVFKEPGLAKMPLENDTQPRKIQICLVINSDNQSKGKKNEVALQGSPADSELEMYKNKGDTTIIASAETANINDQKRDKVITSVEKSSKAILKNKNDNSSEEIAKNRDITEKDVTSNVLDIVPSGEKSIKTSNGSDKNIIKEATQFKANFYKPLTEPNNSEVVEPKNKDNDYTQMGIDTVTKTSTSAHMCENESTLENIEKSPEIPLLHERTIEKQPPDTRLSEIDILQALKNEILSEIAVPGTEITTPLLHQPKVIKVANAQANQILPKKRISIEKYKEKSVTSQTNLNKISHKDKDEQIKKPSLKLTDKECERFFNVPKICFDDEDESLDEDGDGDIEASDVYRDLAPKSPDHEDSSNIESTPPVIIPVDPIKSVPINYKADVDMRALPLLSPNSTKNHTVYNNMSMNTQNDLVADKTKADNKLVDPRVRRDLNPNNSTQSPNPHASNPDKTPRQIFGGAPSSSTSNPIIISNARIYEMTPTHQSFEIDQSNQKHVYASMSWEQTDTIGDRRSHIDERRESCEVSQKKRFSDSFNSDKYGNVPPNNRPMDQREDLYRGETSTTAFLRSDVMRKEAPLPLFGRSDCPSTPSHPFGRLECPPTPTHSFRILECPPTPTHSFGRLECPPTPTHSFGRLECPPTPTHSFGRLECPPTPTHSFGRLECPPTPTHSFGRLECPPTPTHPFGRLDCPSTPNHPFGRLDCPPTPSHPFGRLECPLTPGQSFGRMECPPTPSHSFGRIDCPTTPNHPFGRSECPPTPNHPFGRSEAPPPLMLGVIDCLKTSNIPFTGADGPSTPTPLFGRNDIYPKSVPQKNIYGRTDSLKKQYGRSDYNNPSYFKDPRLNRKSDLESKSQYVERDQAYYKDHDRYRSTTYSSQKSYSGSGSYRHSDRELSAGRNTRYKYFASDNTGRQFNKDQERRDRVVGRSLPKDHERCGNYSKEHRYDSSERFHEEVGSRLENVREKSMGRITGQEDTGPLSRAHGVPKITSNDRNTLSVKSNTGRSFTIDTSINATFQRIIDSAKEIQGFVDSFDLRRRRASSVGRSLTREPCIGQAPPQLLKGNDNDSKRTFQRASSVGREVLDSTKDKRTFQEIKADFISSRFTGNTNFDNKTNETSDNYKSKINLDHGGHNNKDTYEKKSEREPEYMKSSYSPRRNNRDPRVRKLATNKTDRHDSDSQRLKSGIVYSNDNIVKGSILTSGYGVKNYKIPKIKRATEETEETLSKTDSLCKNDHKEKNGSKAKDNVTEKIVTKDKLNAKEKVKTDDASLEKDNMPGEPKEVTKQCEQAGFSECTGKRLTRSSKKVVEEADLIMVGKVRKCKKFIYDSDSDDDIDSKSVNIKIKKEIATKGKNVDADLNVKETNIDEILASEQNVEDKQDLCKKDVDSKVRDILGTDSKSEDVNLKIKNICKNTVEINAKELLNPNKKLMGFISPVKEKKNRNLDCADHESSFGMDELEMFSDNVVSDPVIENITALIADLDNDLNTSKGDSSHNFTKEITLENMMQNISSPARNRLIEMEEEDSPKILEHMDKISNRIEELAFENQKSNATIYNSSLSSSRFETDCLRKALLSKNVKDECSLKDPAGSTPSQSDSENNEENKNDVDSTTESEKPIEDRSKLDDNLDGCSTPDSTINMEDAVLKASNEESLSGSTNEVTSTESVDVKPCSAKEFTPPLNSIGSLLSILQDKSKIKELLSMLGDQSSENEKIKKKLEKLSELVSDDEESCDVPTTNLEVNKMPSSEIKDIKTGRVESIKGVEDLDEQLCTGSMTNETNLKIDDNDSKTPDIEEIQRTDIDIPNIEAKPKKKPVKKTRYVKKAKGKTKKGTIVAVKRITRATVAETKTKVKKIPRELMKLQEDIKEMFIRDEVLSATGIRMCRLAKLVDEKISPAKEEQVVSEAGPVVVLEKFKDTPDKTNETEKNKKKKYVPKMKHKSSNDTVPETIIQNKAPISFKHKPGPKSKTKTKKDPDPYVFESDLVCDTTIEKASEDGSSSNTDSESDSLASCKSYSSTELLSDLKKKTKRKRRGWQAGVIKTKTKRRKELQKKTDLTLDNAYEDVHSKVSAPDLNCFTDRDYCFRKKLFSYSCRLCSFTGTDIVVHYRNKHPHVEIPLSRMAPEVAKEAIEQCLDINFKSLSKKNSDKYVCIFCFKEFANSKSVLETFFWHIVSMHTGEYKQNCSECVNVPECSFNLDIPPPPKEIKGQLTGFICKKCNFTQISVENLKTHVIVRHNDEQTAVYTINLSVMTKKAVHELIRHSNSNDETALQAKLSEQALASTSDKCIESTEIDDSEGVKTRTSLRKSNVLITPPIQSKITFEADDNISETSDLVSDPGESIIKRERIDSDNVDGISNNDDSLATDNSEIDSSLDAEDQTANQPQECSDREPSSDIINCPHFKINVTESGVKEYLCCINGIYHFKTTLLISMKKHIQSKHSENWDGYCYMCKVIVTPQGAHRFNDCLQHYLDKHIDNFPVFEKGVTAVHNVSLVENSPVMKSYINVRPLSELITRSEDTTVINENAALPIIQSVRSLGSSVVETPRLSSPFHMVGQEKQTEKKIFRYEEHQAEVISKKYYLVMETMMTPDNLVKVFKCSGRYCLYATDSTEEALAHATTHQRVGGIDALNCCYCDFDSAGNAVDLVMHVFKSHGNCCYCCHRCFYRAASSQTVGAHISRIHGVTPVPGNVLRTTTVSTIPLPKPKMLTREEAVPYYICGHSDQGDSCKFRTYTPDKFCDHLYQRHTAASAHPCHLCSTSVAIPIDLVQHMKNHGLKLYQCTWCVHGADNEPEMLAHVSIKHPNKQPQAFIRIITNKDSSNTLRVLPLAFLTKNKVPIKDVTPSPIKEHPVREAERSIEMEALIEPFIAEHVEPVCQATEPTPESTEALIQTYEIPEELCSHEIKPEVHVNVSDATTGLPQVTQTLSSISTAVVSSIVTVPVLSSSDTHPTFTSVSASPLQSVAVPTAQSVAVPLSQSVIPPSQTVTVPPSQTVTVPSSQTVTVPPSQSVVVPPSQTVTVPPSQTVTVIPSQTVTVPLSQTVTVPLSQTVTVPSPQTVAVPSPQTVAVPLSETAAVPPSQTVDVPPSPAVAVPPSPAVAVPPSLDVAAPSSPAVAVPPSPAVAVPPLAVAVPPPAVAVPPPAGEVPLLQHVTGPSTSPVTVAPLVVSPLTVSTVSSPATIDPIPILKTEPIEAAKFDSTDVVILDSDDEDFQPTNTDNVPVIDLSDDETSTSLQQEPPKIIPNTNLYTCPQCKLICKSMGGFKKHVFSCVTDVSQSFQCPHCAYIAENVDKITFHYVAEHTENSTFECGLCGAQSVTENFARKHMRSVHKDSNIVFTPGETSTRFIVTIKETQKEKPLPKRKLSGPKNDPIPVKRRFEPQEIDQLPITPILDQLVYCSRCEFSTKVRLNMVRHLQLHAEQQPVPQTAPVNPVPYLESNEKHFDKMVNLASSSIVNRTPEKFRSEHAPSVSLLIPPEAASRYPKYVPERQRHTCGAKGCSYISVDEAMLRRHWDALHSGTSDFHCVHCPPHQHLDTTKPLTATRIISHLKMHDSTLYACSACSYYHFKREALEKHLTEIHKTGRLMVVRERYSAPVSLAPVQTIAAPTMDLKPWQCGLCKFKSMLRPEVVDHCSKLHQSKMQFKCAYCPFRTSAIENVTKHQNNHHAGKPEEVFYYYYREGSISDEIDGTPRWVKQRQKVASSQPEVKVETCVSPKTVTAVTTPLTIDLNLVKKEVNEASESDTGFANIQDLCKKFGQFCEPNGIKYKCPLCSVVTEDTRDMMQSHLYEELNYRKWSCGLCSYKAFHKAGLTEHMTSEHRRQYDHIELPIDFNIERWVSGALHHQTSIINKHKENLANQKNVVDINKPGPSTEIVAPKETVKKYSDKELEAAFGSFGSPNGVMFCCPKCGFLTKDEVPMRDHLEMELNKIRWCCSRCPENFHTYHEAQFHCKSHDGPSRPVEALRDPAMRATWVSTTIQKQKIVIENMPTASSSAPPTPEKLVADNDNSLLVVRYEERVPTPDQVHARRKRTAPDSDDDKLVIEEAPPKKKVEKHCPHCEYKSIYFNNVKIHMLTHFGLKPYSCAYCSYYSSAKKTIIKHMEQIHPNEPLIVKTTELPPEAKRSLDDDNRTLICLVCEQPVLESDTRTHLHENVKPEFSKTPVVHKCCNCCQLFKDTTSLAEHQKRAHPREPVSFVLYRLGGDTKETYKCVHCDTKFKHVKDYRVHHLAAHPTLQFKMTLWSPAGALGNKAVDVAPVVPKRCARKSTTKLPNCVAKKSTTKLPNSVQSGSSDEYSYYGSRAPPLQQYANVTTLMSFCNMMMPFSLKQLSEHLNIEPRVMLTDIKHSSDYKKLKM